MLREEIIKILQKAKEEIRIKYKAEIKGVFGSYARGETKQESDVDILVNFLERATLFDFVDLAKLFRGEIKDKGRYCSCRYFKKRD